MSMVDKILKITPMSKDTANIASKYVQLIPTPEEIFNYAKNDMITALTKCLFENSRRLNAGKHVCFKCETDEELEIVKKLLNNWEILMTFEHWTETESDPENKNNCIGCGMRFDINIECPVIGQVYNIICSKCGEETECPASLWTDQHMYIVFKAQIK
jgi:hypothetical protein